MIHLEPIVFTARLLPDGGEFGDDYTAVATVSKLGKTAYISAMLGMEGKISKHAMMTFKHELEKFGMTRVKWSRGEEFK